MFIKVEREIVDVIIHQQRDKKRERAIDVMVQLMTASRSNHHKVYLKYELDNNVKSDLRAALDENSWREFLKLQKERLDVECLISMLDIYAVITVDKHCSRVGNELYINPFEEKNFCLDVSTYLCTENQRDAVFYKKVADYFLSYNKLLNMSIQFRGWKGGGSDFGNALKDEIILHENFVFAIVDSDKKYPKDKIGRTAESIKFIGHNRFNADYYILSNVTEVENLIPIKFIKKYNPQITNIEKYDLSYFDFKDGLKYQILYYKESRDYWKNNFTEIEINWYEISSMASAMSYSDYCNSVRAKSSLVLGCGSKLLESLLSDKDLDKIRERDFSQSQLLEWNEIGKKVFSWTCCSNKKV